MAGKPKARFEVTVPEKRRESNVGASRGAICDFSCVKRTYSGGSVRFAGARITRPSDMRNSGPEMRCKRYGTGGSVNRQTGGLPHIGSPDIR
jgi:hypothetical protein